MLREFKKSFASVIATVLIIVVAVVALIGFQSWFGIYSSEVYVKTEKETQSKTLSSIETIVGEQLYIKGGKNVYVSKILIDGQECSFTGNITGIQNISITDCINNLSTNSPEVVVVLGNRMISKKIYLKDAVLTSEIVNNLDVGSECRFKDNKTGCEHYYVETMVGNVEAIEDTILGLYWQKDMSSYLDYDGSTLTWVQSQDYCSNLDGGNGWRVPTLVEFQSSLFDISRPSQPYLIDVGFTNIPNWYWSDTKRSSSAAYTVSFTSTSGFGVMFNTGYVVCVKDKEVMNVFQTFFNSTQDFSYESGKGQERSSNDFEFNLIKCGGEGTVYDKLTNLCWQRNMSLYLSYDSGNDLNWTKAKDYCNSFNDMGGNWRVPDKLELMTLLYHNGEYSTQVLLEEIGFNNVKSDYWSNILTGFDFFGTLSAHYISFSSGSSFSKEIAENQSVVCVKTAS